MRLDEWPQQGCGDAADSFGERNKKYGAADMKIPAVINPKKDELTATPALSTLFEHMETLDIVHGVLQMPQGTS